MAELYALDARDRETLKRLLADFRRGVPPRAQSFREEPRGVRFRNDAGEQMPGYAIGRVTGMDTLTEMVGGFYKLAKPSSTFGRIHIVNGSQPVDAGDFGFGQLWGEACYALFDSGTPAAGEVWGPKSGQWSLAKNYPGYNVCGESTSGRTLVVGEPINRLIGKPTATINADASGNFHWYVGAAGSEADTTVDVAAWNKTGRKLRTDDWCALEWIDGAFYARWLEGKATHIAVTFPSALATSDGTKTGCTVTRYSGGRSPGSTVTVTNELAFESDSGAIGYAMLDDDDVYRLWQAECPEA